MSNVCFGSARRRLVRVTVVLTMVVGGAAALAALAGPAAASVPRPPGIFVACGLANVASPTPISCPSLQDAINSATPINGDVRIVMMPGDYCPPTFPDLHNVFWHHLEFVGAGFAALGSGGPPQAFTGVESEATAFTWSSASCQGAPSALVTLANPGAGISNITFRNLSFVGGNTGPLTGLSDTAVPLRLRDVT